ncbi:MAG: AIR synthase related protein [Lutispora sp.]
MIYLHYKDLMEGIHNAANQIGIEILGGHSEITDAVIKPIISVTALGMAIKGEFVN